MKATSSILVTIMATGGIAAAQSEPAPAAAPQPPSESQTTTAQAESGPQVSITWSPVHLVLPLVELTGEYNVAPHMGAALILGAGRVSDANNTITATAYEVGAQINYYPMRRFSGLHVGVEALYLSLGDVEQDMSVTAAGLAVGPYVGYKVQTSIGFAFVAQLGVYNAVVEAESSTAMASDSDFGPLLNLNAGWSF
jgi:hypothetical protein